MKILGIDFFKKEEIVNVSKSEGKKIIDYTQKQQKYRTREDIRKLEWAIDNYNNIVNYNREDLNRIYRRNLEDPHLYSQWETRRLKTKEREFKVKIGDEENEKATEIFEAGWFLDYIDAILNAKLWGFTLVQFGAIDENKFVNFISTQQDTSRYYDAVTEIDRDYVKPELGIVTQQSGDSTGISFIDGPGSEWVLFEGKVHDSGLLGKLSKYLLFKDNVLGNWSEWAEVFGMDVRVGKTSEVGEKRNDFKLALRDLGANGNAVIDPDDSIDYIGTSKSDAFQVYKQFAEYVDGAISKIIFGQDVVSNNTGQVVGTVGENIAALYGDADAKYIQRNVNDKLIPLMIKLGFTGLEGAVFEWDNSENLSLKERSEIDLDVSRMGFQLDTDYVKDVYGVELNEEEPYKPQNLPPIQNKAILNIKDELTKFYGKDVSDIK